MRQMPWAARAYLVGLYILGLIAFSWLVIGYNGPITSGDMVLASGLAIVSAICQVFLVARTSTTEQRSDHLTLAPLFAALVLLPNPLLALLIVFTFLPEWYYYRRSWFGQVFNIAAYLIAAVLALLGFYVVSGQHLHSSPALFTTRWPGTLALIFVFELMQAMMLAGVLKLARGQSLRQSGLFTVDSLLLEFGLICVGLCFAIAWTIGPIFAFAAGMPLILIFQALHVPNLKEEASTDPKTGLANMRHFNTVIERELERVSRNGQPLSMLVCDLDYLRNINNTYGHQAGDMVLQGIADIIRSNIRTNDLGARYGGEEFLIMLADTDSDGAKQLAERIRSNLEQVIYEYGSAGEQIRATISIGVATYPYDGRTAETLLREADLAVYKAKADGRNRVVVAGRETRELAGDWAREHLLPAVSAEAVPDQQAARPLWNFIKQATRKTPAPDPTPTKVKITGSAANRRKQDRQNGTPSPFVLLVIGVIIVAGVLSVLPGVSLNVPWEAILLFSVLTVAAEQLAVDVSGRGKISVSVVVILSAGFLYHETGIIATSLAAAVSMAFKARSPLHRMLFNLGTVLLAARGADLMTTTLLGGSITVAPLIYTIVPAALAGLTYYAINQVLLCIIRGLNEGRRPWQIWYSDYRWLWPHYVVLGTLGLIVALAYDDYGPIGVLALMAPVAMMHFAFAQYVGHTRVYVDDLQQMNTRLTDSYEATLHALSRALDTRDEETEEHSQRVRRYTELLARRLQIPEVDIHDMSRGALLHDIGKIGVPDAILLKPGKLTDDEREMMRKHPEIGYRMIAHIPFLARAALVVLHHHESYDGGGYPSGLTGEYIPLGARIFAIVDTFDAMTSDRPYRRALPIEAAREEIQRCRGTQFDPKLVDIFLSIPVMELVEARESTGLPAEALEIQGMRPMEMELVQA